MRTQHLLSDRRSTKIDEARRMADLLRAQILGGVYRTDDSLPTETELMAEFMTGRNVVRSALALLKLDGYVVRLQGQGTFAISKRRVHDLNCALGIASDFSKDSRRVFTQFRSVTSEPASRVVAESLGIEIGDLAIVAEYITFVDRQPYSVATSYLPHSRFDEAFSRDLEGDWPGDWFEVLAAIGTQIGHVDLQMEAARADDAVAELLKIAIGTALIRFEHVVCDSDGCAIDYGFSRCRSDRLVLRMSLQRMARDESPVTAGSSVGGNPPAGPGSDVRPFESRSWN